MLPGFFLTALYLAYILGWALLNPAIAPKLSPDQYRVAVPEWVSGLERGRARRVLPGLLAALLRPRQWLNSERQAGRAAGYGPVLTFAGAWWYVLIHNAPDAQAAPAQVAAAAPAEPRGHEELGGPEELGTTAAPAADAPQELGDAPEELGARNAEPPATAEAEQPEELGAEASAPAPAGAAEAPSLAAAQGSDNPAVESVGQAPPHFNAWFWGLAALSCLLLAAYYYYRLDGEGLEIARELALSVVPLGVLTLIVPAPWAGGASAAASQALCSGSGAAAARCCSCRPAWAPCSPGRRGPG